MANALFQAYKLFTLGDDATTGLSAIDWETDTIKVVLIDAADDTIAPNTDDALNDIAAGARVATATITSVAVTGSSGTATVDAADTTFTAVTGDQSEQLVVYKDTGTEATSTLAIFYDTFTSGMPVTPNGGNIVIQWNASGLWTW